VVAYRQFTEKKFVSDEKFKVTYLRPSQAEREMLEKNKLKKEENK
jgi:hypothetical protein